MVGGSATTETAAIGTPARRVPLGLLCTVLVAALAVSLVAGVALGSVRIPFPVAARVMGAHLTGQPSGVPPGIDHVVWLLRLPRTLLAAVVGAGLSVAGVAVQALARNPLADPYLLGVSSGGSVGATAVLLFGGPALLGSYALSGAAFAGALVAMTLVFLAAQRRGRITPLRLILAGTAVGYGLSALASFLILSSGDQNGLRSVLHWLLGSLGGARWSHLTLPACGVLLGTGYLLLLGRRLNVLVMAEEAAPTLGVSVTRLRRSVFAVAALLTGLAVAVSGAIGFVGLMVPHAARLLAGPDHRRSPQVAALLGAVFLVWVDIAARVVLAPQELPIGVLTALLGVPFFLWLLRRREG